MEAFPKIYEKHMVNSFSHRQKQGDVGAMISKINKKKKKICVCFFFTSRRPLHSLV